MQDTLFAFDAINANHSFGNAKPEKKRKQVHKVTEQKGRQRINEQINTLKNMLPECSNTVTTKACVLESAVSNLRRLQSAVAQMQAYNNNIMKENTKLKRECKRLRGEEPSEDEFESQVNFASEGEEQDDLIAVKEEEFSPSSLLFSSSQNSLGIKEEPFQIPSEFLDENHNSDMDFNNESNSLNQGFIQQFDNFSYVSDPVLTNPFLEDTGSFSKFNFGLDTPSFSYLPNFESSPSVIKNSLLSLD